LKEAGGNGSKQDRKRAGAADRLNLKATDKSQRAFEVQVCQQIGFAVCIKPSPTFSLALTPAELNSHSRSAAGSPAKCYN